MFSFLFHLGASGEQGASGSPGKDYILHDFVFSLALISSHVLYYYVWLQVLRVQRVSRVKQDLQEQKVKTNVWLEEMT